MRISDWSSDVCSSDRLPSDRDRDRGSSSRSTARRSVRSPICSAPRAPLAPRPDGPPDSAACPDDWSPRSEEHTSELQSLMRISYAVFCLKKQKQKTKSYQR